MQLNMTEFLQEELRVVPSKNELDDFFNDVDELRLSVERLQAHINQLMTSK
jgi:ubiquinone biosynthesis accessory factor UbiJ